jgi:hypothetical protein
MGAPARVVDYVRLDGTRLHVGADAPADVEATRSEAELAPANRQSAR